MKYLIIVPEGAGDEPVELLGGRTPLEAAEMINIDELARRGAVGMAATVPAGAAPGLHTGNLSVMGYHPSDCPEVSSPLEALSLGMDMSEDDVAFSAGFVSLEGDAPYEDLVVRGSGSVTPEESGRLMEAVDEAFGSDWISFRAGTGIRHCMVARNGPEDCVLTPPGGLPGEKASDHLPRGEGTGFIRDIMKRSYDLLKDHPVNRRRAERGMAPVNALWIWGQGRKPSLPSIREKYGIDGTAVSSEDAVRGIAICAGLDSVECAGVCRPGLSAGARAAIKEFRKGKDLVYIHLNGPDECSRRGDLEGKIGCLERIDREVLKPLVVYLRESGDEFRILEVPGCRTPLSAGTMSAQPVPFAFYDSSSERHCDEERSFNERSGEKGMYFNSGFELANFFFRK